MDKALHALNALLSYYVLIFLSVGYIECNINDVYGVLSFKNTALIAFIHMLSIRYSLNVELNALRSYYGLIFLSVHY